HLGRLEFLQLVEGLPFDFAREDRRRRLADGTAVPVKPGFFHAVVLVEQQFQAHLIAAERIFILVRDRRLCKMPAVVRGFEMVENMIVVEFVAHRRYMSFSRSREGLCDLGYLSLTVLLF